MPDSTQKMIREIRALGWSVTPTRGGHLSLRHPDVKGQLYCPASPSDRNNWQLLLNSMRRALKRGRAGR